MNSLALFYNFGKSWKSDPGIIKASEEQKKKVSLRMTVKRKDLAFPKTDPVSSDCVWGEPSWTLCFGPPLIVRLPPASLSIVVFFHRSSHSYPFFNGQLNLPHIVQRSFKAFPLSDGGSARASCSLPQIHKRDRDVDSVREPQKNGFGITSPRVSNNSHRAEKQTGSATP